MKLILVFFFVMLEALAQSSPCCINSNLINLNNNCYEIYDPVIGCDNILYSNPCYAQNAGLVSYQNLSGQIFFTDFEYLDQDSLMNIIFSGGMEISSCYQAIKYLNSIGYENLEACNWNESSIFTSNYYYGMVLSDFCSCSCSNFENINTFNTLCDSIEIYPILPLAFQTNFTTIQVNIFANFLSNNFISYAGLILLDNNQDTIAVENINSALNVYGIGSQTFETRTLELTENIEFPFNGEICLIENYFSGQPETYCCYPVTWNSNIFSLDENKENIKKNIFKNINLMGQEFRENQNLNIKIIINNDGSFKKVIQIE